MEYSLRNKSISPPSLRQRKVLNRDVKPANILPAKSRTSSKVNEPSQATSKTENSDSTALLSKEDTIGKRLCRRRSTAGNLGSVSLTTVKGKLGRKSCLEKTIKTDIELEESPADNNSSSPVNCRVVESASKSEVESEVCETQPSDGDTIASNTRRGRKSCFVKIALIPEIGEKASPSGAASLKNLVIEPTSKKSEVISDFNERQPSSGEPIASKGKVKSGRKSCFANIISDDDNGIPCENIGLQKDSEKRVFESQARDGGSESSAEGIKRRLVRVSKESEATETVQAKVTRSNRKRKISESCTIYEASAAQDHVLCEAEVTKINSKSALISLPTKAFTYVDSSSQTETNLSIASISSWEVTDSREVTVESSQTSYSSFCKTKGTQYSLGLKNRSTQTIVGEMVHKGTSTEDTNPSYEGDLMVLMLDAVKRLRESRCEFLISSATSPSSNNSVNEDVTSLPGRSNVSEKTQGLSRKRCFSSGSKSKEKSEVKSDAVIAHSSVVPISPSLQVSPVTSKSVVSGKPAVDDSFRSPTSMKDTAENTRKLRHSKVSCEVAPKDHDQPREERTEKKKLRRLNRKEVDESPISISVTEKNEKGANEKDENVKTPADKHETVKKLSDTSGNSSAFKSTISVTVAVEDSREISTNEKDGQLNKLPEKSEKKGSIPGCDSSTVKVHTGSTQSHNVQRSKVSLRRRTDSGSEEKVSTSSCGSIQKDGTISPSNQKKSSNEKEDKMLVSNVTKRAGVTPSPASRRSSSDEKLRTLNVAKRNEMTPSPTPRRSSSDEKAEKLGTLNVAKRTEIVFSPTPRSSSVEKAVTSNSTKRTEMTPSPSSRRSSSVEKIVSSNAAKRTEMTTSTTLESTLQKSRKSFSGVAEAAAKESSPTTKDSTADVFVKPSSSISIKEKRSSGKGVCEAPEGAQKVGNTSKLSPPISLRILKHQRKSGPSPTASATNLRRKSAGEKDGRVLKDGHSHKGEVTGYPKDPVEMEVSSGPDSSTVDDLGQEVKQEIIDYSYSKDDDDDVLSLYPESEYAEMFGILDNQLSNVSDSYIGDKCPSPSMYEEANDHSMAPIVAESSILSMEESIENENEKQKESTSCTEDVRPEEIVTGEADADNVNVSKPEPRDEKVNDEPVVDENSSISAVNVGETLPVTSEQILDSKNDTQTAENTEGSSGADLDSHPKEDLDSHTKEELNFSAPSEISEEMKEVPKKVDAKVESDGVSVEQQKQSVELVTSSMENDAESNSVYEEERKRSSKSTSSSPKSAAGTDKSERSLSRDRNNSTPIFKGICYRFMRGLSCRCQMFSHKFPPQFGQKMEFSDSLDIYNTLLFAINRGLVRFLSSYGTACVSILSSRKEGNFLMAFLQAYAKALKGNAKFWHVALKLIVDCGNCCENSILEVISYVVEHILSMQGLSEKMYSLLVGKILSIACNFKDINSVCKVLDSLELRGISIQECTLRKLLQLIHFATTEADRSRISYKIASLLLVAYFIIPQEDRELFCNMIEVLRRNGHEGLLEELERKSMPVSNDLNPQNDSHVAQLVKVNEKSNEVTPRKMGRQSSIGSQSQGKKFRRISETEGDTLVPSKRARISSGAFAIQDLKRRESLKNPYLTGNDLLRRQSSGGAYSQHLESQYLSIEHRPSSSSMSSGFPSWSPVHRYGPNDDNERDRRDFEAAFTAPLSSPLPTSAHGSSLFPRGARSQPNDPVNKSLPSAGLNENSFKFWRSSIKKEDGKQSFLPNASVPPLIPDASMSPSIRKGFSKFGDPSAETKQFRKCSSPLVRNTPSTASSEGTSGSTIEQNFFEQPSSSSAISLSLLQKKPDSFSEKVLEEAFKKSKWSPGMVLSVFSPWLNSPKRQVQLSKLSCKILEQDYTRSAFSLKSLLHCLGSQDLRSNKKFDDIKKILSTVIFNLILRMVISDAWSDAYKFLRMANSANLPVFLAEAFIEEEMSISRKFLVLSEVCFRVNAMDEAIGYLNKGNLFGPVSCWKYTYLEGDLEIQVTFLLSLLSKLASGGFSETAPSIFMTIYTAQKGLYRPVDLTVHVNKVILCALNGSCIKQAYEVYMTLVTSAVKLPKTTYRALLIGLVSNQKYLLARNLYLQVCGLEVYPAFKGDEIQHEITMHSYWQKEEIFIILDNAVRIMYENEVKMNPNKEIHDLEMNIHIEVSDTPEDLSVPWIPLKDDGNEDCQELIPHSLALTSNSLEEAHDRVSYVLEQMFIPPILYDSIVIKEEMEELLTLHPDSLGAHIYERFFCDSGYCE